VYVYRDKKNFVHVATLKHKWHQFQHTVNRVLKLIENFQIYNLIASPNIQVKQSASTRTHNWNNDAQLCTLYL